MHLVESLESWKDILWAARSEHRWVGYLAEKKEPQTVDQSAEQ